MDEKRRKIRPVAIAAMGDPAMEDDGLALRVMGRVRPLLGEIALVGERTLPFRMPGGKRQPPGRPSGKPAWLRAATVPVAPGARSRSISSDLSQIVDWIEGGATIGPIQHLLEGRKRVVLLVAAQHGASPGGVKHWHVDRSRPDNLSAVRFYTSVLEDSFDHLPFWMEEGLPDHGTDLIAVEPYRISPSSDLSPVIRSRLSAITSQVGGLLVRILEEEGWRPRRSPGADPPRRSRRGSGPA